MPPTRRSLLSLLQRGNRLILSELSRLGRSLGQVVAILDAFAKVDVAVVGLKENIRVEGKVGADPGLAGVPSRRRGPLDVSTCTSRLVELTYRAAIPTHVRLFPAGSRQVTLAYTSTRPCGDHDRNPHNRRRDALAPLRRQQTQTPPRPRDASLRVTTPTTAPVEWL
ncbi:MAG: recombinase family protein [Acidobacteria bacterium]|nr:recombinase family protein [Acidobacteriota bacterium]